MYSKICRIHKLTHTVRQSILWAHFSDMTVGTQQRRKYKMFYHEGIFCCCWTPIFAPSQQFLLEMQKVQEGNFQ